MYMYIYRAANSISPTSPNLSHIHKNNKNPETTESKFPKKKPHIMVKPESSKSSAERSNDSAKYKGVRKRKWGKWVSEIRLPNSRERIWLGSYDSAEKAARAFDAALFCLRGHSAKFNFPENPPDIVGGRSLTPSEIQVAAARFANSEPRPGCPNRSFPESSSSSSSQMQVESPSPSVSDGAAQLGSETTLDGSFLDLFSTMGSDNITMPGGSFDIFPGFDDFSNEFYVPPLPSVDDVGEDNCDVSFSQDSFLWNFN